MNGGAHIVREFALGRGRLDVCVAYAGKNYPVEVKLSGRRTRDKNLEQTAGYMDKCEAKEGWLVIFDRDPEKPWEEKITWSTESVQGGKIIHVLGC